MLQTAQVMEDMAACTDGDIYIGVVGPVRTGKSTFIKRFMEQLVLPGMEPDSRRDRALDELPQSGAGRSIMTTEPKFVPEQAASLKLAENQWVNVRLIDCVGYIVPSSLGYFEDEAPRMVKTPWFDHEIPFNLAAEVGTRKVITEHSTVGVVVTTDGTISEIPRAEYQEAEQRVIEELKLLQKPFVVLLNSTLPHAPETKALAEELSEVYQVPVLPVSCPDLTQEDIVQLMSSLMSRFPVRELSFRMPGWVRGLPEDHWLKQKLREQIRQIFRELSCFADLAPCCQALSQQDILSGVEVLSSQPGEGCALCQIHLEESLFNRILSEYTGLDLSHSEELFPLLSRLTKAKEAFDRIQGAWEEAQATGYGIVMPTMDQLVLEDPKIIKQGGKYGVNLSATAPSIHLIKSNITAQVNPIVGSESQSEELVHYLMKEFEENPQKLWDSNIFGKSLHELVNEGLHNKLSRMPPAARMKIQETIERIINEGCSGLICILI